MVHIEIIEPEANAGETGRMTTSTSSGVQPTIGTSKPDGTAKAETNNDGDTPLARLARAVKVSIEAGFVDSAMLLNLEKAYNPTTSAGAEGEAKGTNNIAAQTSASTIIGPNNNIVGIANDADTKIFFGEDMWETLARRAWSECGETFFTEISKMTTYRDLFVKGLTSDGRNGGWFEKVSADIGGGRAALEYYASRSHLFDEILREDAGDDAADTIEVVLAALTYLNKLEDAQRHDDDEDDDGVDGESVNGENEYFSRATIALDALPKLVGLLKSAAVPASVQGGALYLLSRIKFVEDVVSAGAIQPTVNLLGSSDDPKVQYCGLDLLCRMAANEPNYCSELIQAGVVEAMLSYVDRKKSSFWNQASPAEGLLLPDDGHWKGRRILKRWGRLLVELTSHLPSSEVMDMKAVIPCLTSLIGEPIFHLSHRGSLGAAVGSMFESALILCGSTEDKIRNAFVDAGILTTSFALLNEGLGISQERLAATLLILRYCFTAPGRESYSQAILDAGFFDIAIALLGGGHGVNVMVATCRVLLDLAESNLEPFSADICMTIARIVVEADGDAEVELTVFFSEFLTSLVGKRLAPLKGGLFVQKVAKFLFSRGGENGKAIDDLVGNLIEMDIVELLLTKLESANDQLVVRASMCSILSLGQLCRVKDGTATGRACQSLMSHVAMPLLSVMERNEGNKRIQKSSSRILKLFHPDSSRSGYSKRFFQVIATPFALGFTLAWCAFGLKELVMGFLRLVSSESHF